MRVTAEVERHDRWWVVTVPEVDGAFTQARRLVDVPAQAADAVATLLDISPGSVEVSVELRLDDEVNEAFARATELREQSARANAAAAAEQRKGVAALLARGLTLRDIASVLGVSVQRAHQLTGEASAKA